jgi:glycosyltransferase involved in cell wall biosynthesis
MTNDTGLPPLRVLFVTWDGPQVSYLEGLFLPIFAGLARENVKFDVLQFHWADRLHREKAESACRLAGVGYRDAPVRRWGGGAGPLVSAIMGRRHVRSAVRAFGSDVIMPRSMMAGIAALSAGGPKLRPLLFDADGLEADERVDVAGLSPTSATYRVLRDVEAQLVRLSTSVITRTRRAAEILAHRAGPPSRIASIQVVANGRDEKIFHPFDPGARAAVRRQLGIADSAPLLAYAGSIGPQYGMAEMKTLFQEVRRLRPDARLLVMTGNLDRAEAALQEEKPGALIMRVQPKEVPQYLAASDVGLAYRSPIFSMQAVAPIKLSEYLLCGLPVIGTPGIGETQKLVEAGLLMEERRGAEAAAHWLIDEVLADRETYRQRARSAGKAQFSLQRSIEDYARALEPFRALVRQREAD